MEDFEQACASKKLVERQLHLRAFLPHNQKGSEDESPCQQQHPFEGPFTQDPMMIRKIIRTIKDSAQQPYPLKYIVARLLVKTGWCKYLKIERDGYKLIFFESNVSVSMWLSGKQYYRAEEALIKKLLRHNDNFVDVGSNVGHLSIVAKKQVKNGQVIAIEAHPKTAEFASKNFLLNEVDVQLLNCGVGAIAGSMHFTDLVADDMNYVIETSSDGREIPVRTLDDILAGLDEIRLLKIDIEGYELMALQGAKHILSRVTFIYFEVWRELTAKYRYSPSDLIKFLEDLNFNIYHVTTLDQYKSLSSDEDFSTNQNLLAVSKNCDGERTVL